jgi:DNA-binding MarR family transcriptional regulator
MKINPSNERGSGPCDPVANQAGPSEQDHVDRVRAQWRAVRPDLDTAPVAIVARIGRIAAYFDQSTDALMGERGLGRTSWDVLASLRRAGPPYELSPTELYQALMRSSGAMTNRLRRLERAGLIERRPDPGDGRGRLVRLTARGLKLVDEIAPIHLENEERLLASLTDQDRVALEDLLRRLARSLEKTRPTPPTSARRAVAEGTAEAPARSTREAEPASSAGRRATRNWPRSTPQAPR